MADAQPNGFPLFLRPPHAENDDRGTLEDRVRKIVNKNGKPFRYFTEAGLEDEIRKEELEAGSEDESEAEEDEDQRGTLEHVRDTKKQMVEMIG